MHSYNDDEPLLTPLVIGLTKSPTLMGVPYMAIVLIVGMTVIGWIALNSIWMIWIAPVSYLTLFFLCSWDAKILNVLQVVMQKTPRTRNKSFWGVNSYGP